MRKKYIVDAEIMDLVQDGDLKWYPVKFGLSAPVLLNAGVVENSFTEVEEDDTDTRKYKPGDIVEEANTNRRFLVVAYEDTPTLRHKFDFAGYSVIDMKDLIVRTKFAYSFDDTNLFKKVDAIDSDMVKDLISNLSEIKIEND